MGKAKCFIAIGHLRFGGIQKSLLSFLEYVLPFAEVDLLVWDNVGELKLPKGVNLLNTPTVKSVKYSIKRHGLFSKFTFYSALGCLTKKRWKVLPKIKKRYDVAISYTNGGVGKYFVIDKVNARKKYTFFHNGAYEEKGNYKIWDSEYYAKYDKVFAVSEHIKQILISELGGNINFDVCPNLINFESIKEQGQEPCEIMDSFNGLKILSVGRLAPEKNPLIIPEIAKVLKQKSVNFKWFIVGAGDMSSEIQSLINKNGLESNVVLCGGQLNPYKFMSRCDIYAQFSNYEADPITAKEVSVFNKKMILSDIESFRYLEKQLKNVYICSKDQAEIVDKIQSLIGVETQSNNDLSFINQLPENKIKEIFNS